MEDYVATDQRPVDQCLNDIERSDIYVGLFGFRYGYIPPALHHNPQGLSITELEFRRAEELHKPCLTFVVDEATAWPRSYDDAHTAEDKGQSINKLRQYVLTEKHASLFSFPHQLASLVLASITKYLEDQKHHRLSSPRQSTKAASVYWNIQKHGSPYPGLLHFTRKYAPVFFGRDTEIGEILDRLRAPEGRFMIISGDSGIGKSSVVDAGLLPKLETPGFLNGQTFHAVRMVPSQRQQPLEALMGTLASLVTQAGLRPDKLLEVLIQNPDMLGTQIKNITKNWDFQHKLLLFLDQMEELFTSHDRSQANRFLTALLHATQEDALWVASTIRSDHLHYCHRHPDMVNVLNGQGHYALGPVKPYMMKDMILKPAQAAGLTITESFAKRLIQDTEVDAANLPLLGFALDRLYQEREGQELSEKVYDKLGGIAGAIGVHVQMVENTIRSKLGVKTDEVLPTLFQTLAKVQKEESVPTRNRPKKVDFPATLHPVIDLLVNERLLRTEGEGEDSTISITHEKLFKTWPSLSEYIETNTKTLIDRTLLESRAKKWDGLGRPWVSGLATGKEYLDFGKVGFAGNNLTREFLRASRRATWIRRFLIFLPIILVFTATWLVGQGWITKYEILRARSKIMSIHLEPEMVKIPGGKFRQGDIEKMGDEDKGDEQPIREVTINPFFMGTFEVTTEEYERYLISKDMELRSRNNPGGNQKPVTMITWTEATAYTQWLSEVSGRKFRLPTESEWEWAARGGKLGHTWAGTSDSEQLKEYAIFYDNSKNSVEPIGVDLPLDQKRKPNGFGLYDMSGNAWEWVQDCYHKDYVNAPTDGSAWLESDGGNCERRMMRGGSWDKESVHLRTSNRGWNFPDFKSDEIGFRLAEDLR